MTRYTESKRSNCEIRPLRYPFVWMLVQIFLIEHSFTSYQKDISPLLLVSHYWLIMCHCKDTCAKKCHWPKWLSTVTVQHYGYFYWHKEDPLALYCTPTFPMLSLVATSLVTFCHVVPSTIRTVCTFSFRFWMTNPQVHMMIRYTAIKEANAVNGCISRIFRKVHFMFYIFRKALLINFRWSLKGATSPY